MSRPQRGSMMHFRHALLHSPCAGAGVLEFALLLYGDVPRGKIGSERRDVVLVWMAEFAYEKVTSASASRDGGNPHESWRFFLLPELFSIRKTRLADLP